ncbi:cytochrome c oxidase subunit IV [Nocardioides sp. J9]|uniref:cytochrome C oxidase subunit IV family protein n=1 Tax=Nocardioides sp. J9 TaxID=935844 RepID=UPI0011AB1C4E|nr:cytochrome C oxidase subunit IV family protein [Nocardioides sp. J9]TWG94931.1 cytochrome c oxidase subunit IV [Nocardioides sp. J9]
MSTTDETTATIQNPGAEEATASRRALVALIILVALTLLALLLTTGTAHDLASVRVLSAVAAVLAFVKARLVALDFMELRGTALQRTLDVWIAVVGTASVLLLLR